MKASKIIFLLIGGLAMVTAIGAYYAVTTGIPVVATTPRTGIVASSGGPSAPTSASSIEVVSSKTDSPAEEANLTAEAELLDQSPTASGQVIVSAMSSDVPAPVIPTVSAEVGDQTVTTTHFQTPTGITIDSAGNLYVTDATRHVVRKITPSLAVATWAGSSGSAGNANGQGTAARFNTPKGIAHSNGTLYVADAGNGTLRKVTTSDGTVSTLATVTGESVAVDSSGTAYVGDYNGDQVRKVTSSGTVTTFAGASAVSTSSAKIDVYTVTGDIDPVDPRWRTWQAPGKGDQSAGLAPVAITEGLYGLRLELTEDTAATIAYTATDFPDSRNWWRSALPSTVTYGKTWVFPLMAFHRGTSGMDNQTDALVDSQLWAGVWADWIKQSANVVIFEFAGDNPDVFDPLIYRKVTLTFTGANNGTFTAQYGLYPTGSVYQPGVSPLSKILATTTGRFVINRTSQVVPTQNDAGYYSGFWID